MRKIFIIVFILINSYSNIIFGQSDSNIENVVQNVTDIFEQEDIPMQLKMRIINANSAIGKSYKWEKSSSKKQGLDPKILNRAFTEAKNSGYINSIIVIKNGYLVKEEYYNGGNKDVLDLTFSVTKSITSALIGIAIDKGYIKSIDQKIIDFFPEYNTVDLDKRIQTITIKHILTMQAGFDNENNISEKMKSAKNMIEAILNSSLQFDPGTDFLYSTYGSHILSGIITKASNMSTEDFALKYLFNPIGIKSVLWPKDQNGINIGGAGVLLTPRDMARFGYLYLQKGYLNEQQLIPSDWIAESIINYRDYDDSWEEITNLGYSYQWWTGQMDKYPIYFASGYGGQWILVIPSLNIVIVTTMNANSEKDWKQMTSFIPLVYNYIIPSVKTEL